LKNSNAYEFVNNKDMFPEGLETLVGEKGVKLSGG
jgi:ABC-type multidrug transport system fused ATPase/permease subunit